MKLFSLSGGLLALDDDALRVAELPAAEAGRASEELLRGAPADAVLRDAERIPLPELVRVTAPVLGRSLDLAWGTRRRSLRFGDRKTRDAALDAVASLAPGLARSRDRVPRALAALLPLAAAGLSAVGIWLSNRAVGAVALGLSLLWLAAWLWRPPDRMRLERR